MLTVIVMECESEPLVPVTVIVYPPIGVLCNALTLSVEVPCTAGASVTDELPMAPELTVSVDVAVAPELRTRLVGFTVAANPVPAETDRETVPENPPRLAAVMVDVPEEPATILTVEELEARLKSACCA